MSSFSLLRSRTVGWKTVTLLSCVRSFLLPFLLRNADRVNAAHACAHHW